MPPLLFLEKPAAILVLEFTTTANNLEISNQNVSAVTATAYKGTTISVMHRELTALAFRVPTGFGSYSELTNSAKWICELGKKQHLNLA